ncbi:uncharacterized protein LOC130445847 [Diorhabda sublineata]|uniref:uncharacterized protein LOC130445847 n=1 Tax=Diorhabda sublineata TaxID=1163346 RepID=UPI0024E0CF99|nr:uncharacterized protein LOC130445847 [Diorhabda sublineata]
MVKEDENLPDIKRKTLCKILYKLNFTWEKQSRKSVLIDNEEIICWKRQYLRDIRKYRQEGRQIYYLDETWLNEGHSVKKIWQDESIQTSRQAFIEGLSTGLKTPIGKGRRLIITHIGYNQGFVDNANYHLRLTENLPSTSWRKADIRNWLIVKDIPFEDDMLKKELLKVASDHKLQFKKFVIDEIAKIRGITMLRLPPYHCDRVNMGPNERLCS